MELLPRTQQHILMNSKLKTDLPAFGNLTILEQALFYDVKFSTRFGTISLSHLVSLPLITECQNTLSLTEVESTYRGVVLGSSINNEHNTLNTTNTFALKVICTVKQMKYGT